MNALDYVRKNIEKLYKTNPNVHVNVDIASPKVKRQNEPVLIKGVYPHIFQIEEQSTKKTYTLQYSDVLHNHIEILELKKTITA